MDEKPSVSLPPSRTIKPRRGVSAVRKRRYPGDIMILAVPDFAQAVVRGRTKPLHGSRSWSCRMLMYAVWLMAFGGKSVRKSELVAAFVGHALHQDVPYFRNGDGSNKKAATKAAKEEACKQLQNMLDAGLFVVEAAPVEH